MNCREVMELMQRQLDGDLDTQEEARLAAHQEYCSDCAKMFERLKLLSNELTSLPKVVPNYSLVDAILPKLNEIDLQKAGSGQDISTFTNTQAAQQPQAIPWTRRFGASISWKVAGGVIAAGLIWGFLLVNKDNPFSNQADSLLSPQTGAQTASSGISNQKMDTIESKVSGDQLKMNAAQDHDTAAVQDQYGNSKGTEQGAAGSQPKDKAVKPSLEPKAKASTPVKQQSKEDSGAKVTDPTVGAEPAASTIEPLAKEEPAGQASGGPKAMVSSEGDAATSNIEPAPVAKEVAPVPKKDTKSKARSNNIMSFTSIMPEETLASNDGKFIAAIEQHHVAIKDSATQEIRFASKHVWTDTDKVTLIEWSEDGKLTYQVSNDSSTQNFQIDVVHKLESLLK